ncbi:MAG: zinc ribbon domain-containing protein, partial [SAR324 cluster bacterium]|nr:zinc ribbon domain-containing protein [SAR324 cluster bacterium]
MECSRCHHENPSDSRFCFECGLALEQPCSSCGKPLPPGVKFCNACGQAVSEPSAPATPDPPVESSAPPSGERRQATVVFSDLSGYTAMNERLDPEEVQGLMRR